MIKMKKHKKMIINFIIFTLLIVLTFYIVLKEQDLTEMFNVLKSVKIQYILIAIISMCIYVTCEAINIGRTLKGLNEKTSFLRNIKYALIGFFFSGITPAASGGQPMQVYYMHRDKLSVGNSTMALLINLSCMQIVTISLALVSVVFKAGYLTTVLIWCFVIGILLNLSALTILMISIFSKKTLNGIIKFVIKIMQKFKMRNVEEKEAKLIREAEKYQAGSEYIKKNKKIILKMVLTTYIQFIAFYSVDYWVYCAFGLNGQSIISIIAMQSILYGTVSGIPSPGAVGVSEGGFFEIFKTVFPSSIIGGAMLLIRGINFYFLLMVSGIVAIISTLITKKLKKDEICDINVED